MAAFCTQTDTHTYGPIKIFLSLHSKLLKDNRPTLKPYWLIQFDVISLKRVRLKNNDISFQTGLLAAQQKPDDDWRGFLQIYLRHSMQFRVRHRFSH